jgi:uncharacterized C2H2 Zn-finger protein
MDLDSVYCRCFRLSFFNLRMEKQEREDKLRCGVCSKIFSSVSTKNRHLKVVHGLQEEKTYQHICCPLCDGEKK